MPSDKKSRKKFRESNKAEKHVLKERKKQEIKKFVEGKADFKLKTKAQFKPSPE